MTNDEIMMEARAKLCMTHYQSCDCREWKFHQTQAENAKLRRQVEEMRSCGNCEIGCYREDLKRCNECNDKSYWQWEGEHGDE
jgi:hypothetical protein